MIAGSLRVPLPSCGRDRRLRRLQPAREPVAHRRAAVGDHPLERAVDRAAVGRRRDDLLGVVGERDEPEPEVVRRLVDEHLGRLDRGGEPVGLDVVGAHRAGDVVDEHDGRGALRRGDAALRPRDGEDQRGEREQQQQRGQVAAPAGPRGDDVRACSAGLPNAARLAAPAALHRRVGEHRDRQQREAEQDGGLAEASCADLLAAAAARGRVGGRPRSAAGCRGSSPRTRARRPRRGRDRRRPSRRGARGRRGAGGAARSRSQSPSVESTRWSAPARRSAAATSSRSAAAAALKRWRTRRRLVLTTIWRPVSGSTIQTSPTARQLELARVAHLDRQHAVARAQAAQRRLPVARAAEVGDDDDEPARPRERRPSRSRRSPSDVAPAPSSAPARRAARRAGPSSPSAALARAQHARLRRRRTRRRRAGCRAASRRGRSRATTPSATSALRRSAVPNCIDGETSSISQAVIARSPTCTRTCGSRIRAVTFQSM